MYRWQNCLKSLKGYFNPTDIYMMLRPLIFVCTFSGVASIRLSCKSQQKRLEVLALGLITTIMYISVFAICFIFTIYDKENFVRYIFRSDVSRIAGVIQLCISFFSMTINYTCSFVQRFKLIHIIEALAKIDERFMALGIRPDYKKSFNFIIGILVINVLSYVVYVFGSFGVIAAAEHQTDQDKLPGFSVWISYFLPHFVVSIVVIIFASIIRQIRNRLAYINEVK